MKNKTLIAKCVLAKHLKVSRQTVQNWYSCEIHIHGEYSKEMDQILVEKINKIPTSDKRKKKNS